MALAAIFYAAHLLREPQGRAAIAFPPLLLPLAFFCSLTIISILFSTAPVLGAFAVRKLVLFLILLLTVNLVVSRRHLVALYAGLFFEATLAAVVGTVQFVREYRMVKELHPGRVYFYMSSSRIRGFMGHWMHFGGQQMLVLAALMSLLLVAGIGGRGVVRSRRPGTGAALWWVILALVGLSIVLNFTRGVWLGCFVAAVYLVARSKPRWLLALPAVVALIYVASPSLLHKRLLSFRHPSQDPSLSIRFEMWHAGLRMVRAHPWLGVGPNNIPVVYNSYLPPGTIAEIGFHDHLHNDYLQFAAERGLPCLGAWLWFMTALLWGMLEVRRQVTGSRVDLGDVPEAEGPGSNALRRALDFLMRADPIWIVDGAIAGWLALMTEGAFEFNFGSSPVLMAFLFMVSTAFVDRYRPALVPGSVPPSSDRPQGAPLPDRIR